MPSGRTSSAAELLLTLASRIPWWIDLLLALGAYIGFGLLRAHLVLQVGASIPNNAATHAAPPVVTAVNSTLAHAWIPVAEIFASAFRYLIPAFFLIGGLVSFFKTRRQVDAPSDDN
jgi:hypothetical protein